MTHVGYGLLMNGKPHGVWPVPKAHAERRKKILDAQGKGVHKYLVVSVYIDVPAGLLRSMENEKG